MQFVPLLFLRGDQHQHQIRAHRKIHRLIGDDHGVEVGFQPFQPFVHHGDQVRADGVHLGVKFAANHAVSEVNQACSGVPLDFAAGFFQRFQKDDAFRLFDSLRSGGADIKNGGRAFLRLVKPLAAAREDFFNDRWKRPGFFLYLPRERFHSDRVYQFEWPELPAEPPAQGAIHIHNVFGYFRNTARRIQAHLGKPAPDELLGLVALLSFQERADQRTQPLARVLDGLAHFERSEFRLLPRAVLHGMHVEGENFFFSFAAHFFVKALAGLVA